MFAEYVSALSNSAALRGKPKGYLVWGVEDTTHEIVGTDFLISSAKKGNEKLESWLARMVNPKLNMRIREPMMEGGKRVTLLEIPAASRETTKAGTVAYIRIGSNRKPLAKHPDREAELWRILDTTPYEARIAAEDALPDKRAEYEIELRIVRFPIGDGFENIVTNLPEGAFTAADVQEIYRMRWGVETSFRKFQLNIGAANLHSRRAPLVAQEIYARMVLYDFCAAIARYASTLPRVAGKRGRKHAHKVNFADAARACFALLRGRARGPDVIELVAGSTSPVRPGRSFDRRHRLRSPSGQTYRPA